MPLLKANDFWKPNTYYYNTERYKSLIEKDNTLYICNESHLSQDELDATKFNVVSGSGGSGGLTESQVNTLIEDALQDFTPSGAGGGFSFGGDWDATPIDTGEIASIPSFDELYNATVSGNVLTQIGTDVTFGATATNLSHDANMGTLHEFRVTVPDILPGGEFFVGIHNSKLEEGVYSYLIDTTATVRGVKVLYNMTLSFIKNVGNTLQSFLPHSVEAGDILKVGYRSDTSAVYIYNETQGNVQLIGESAISGFSDGLENLTVYAQAAGSSLSFDFADDYPIYQSVFDLDYPEDLTKTYRVSAANAHSVVNGKLLKVNDFVNFITQDDDVIDVVVSRLVSDSNIRDTISTDLNDSSSSLYGLVRDLGGETGLDYVEADLDAATNDAPSKLKPSLDNFLAYLLNNDQSFFYGALQMQVQNAVYAYIQDDLQNTGTIYSAIEQYISDSTTGVAGHDTIQAAIENSIQLYADSIGVGSNGQIHSTVQDAALATISNEIQSGGIIDAAIQTAINP